MLLPYPNEPGDMKYTIQFTSDAKADIQELKAYVVQVWSKGVWKTEAEKLRQLVTTLETMPWSGSIPAELADIGVSEFRQRLSDHNRLIYCIDERKLVVTILLVCSQRRDLLGMLRRRLLLTR
jgi:toxin ParE1/3/4